jgi:heptosyltransferase-2
MPHVASIERILIRGTNWVGDSIMTIPALRQMRRLFPAAHLTLLVRRALAGLFREADFVDEVLAMELGSVRDYWRAASVLRSRRYDLAVLLPNAFSAALLARAAGIPIRAGYPTDGRGWLLTHRLSFPPDRRRQHQVYAYLHLVAEVERQLLGTTRVSFADPIPRVTVSEERKREALAFLAERGVDVGRKIVVMNPGAVNSRAKQWLPERFAAVGDAVLERGDTAVVLIGTRAERAVSEAVRRHMRRAPVVVTGETSLDLMVAILRCAHLVISNDTGAAHVAPAVGTPVIVLFGPTEEVATRPFSDRAVVIRRPVACAPCMRRECPIDHRCMRAITVEDVLRPAWQLLEGEKREPPLPVSSPMTSQASPAIFRSPGDAGRG